MSCSDFTSHWLKCVDVVLYDKDEQAVCMMEHFYELLVKVCGFQIRLHGYGFASCWSRGVAGGDVGL